MQQYTRLKSIEVCKKGDFLKKTAKYILLLSMILVLWNTYIVKPIKIVAMFVHEVGHFLMTFVFQDKLFRITLSEFGHKSGVNAKWFASFMIANGGYILSLLFAIFILKMKDVNQKRRAMGIISAVILVSVLYIEKVPASFLYIIIFSVTIMVAYILNNDKIFEWLNDIIGISAIAYCIYETFMKDILPKISSKIDILRGFSQNVTYNTDAETLHKITGIPAVIWGILWLVIAIMVLIFCMKDSKAKRRYSR